MTHLPSRILSTVNILYTHDGSNTTSDSFTYSVEDPTGNTLAGQTFSITVTAIDDDTPTVTNQSLTVAEGAANVVLTTGELSSTDADTDDATLIYTVSDVSNGTLTIKGSAWASGTNDSFTQQDIIDGNIIYSHDGSNTTSDSFSYSVEDPSGNTLAGQTFSITVTAADDDAPTVTNQSLTVAEGATNVVLTTSELSSTDADTTDATLIYTVGNVTNGSLTINGSVWASGTNDTFTQQDIIDGNILYTHDGSNTTSDSFTYTVEDPTGNTLTGQTFSITVTTVDDDAPVQLINTGSTVTEGGMNTISNSDLRYVDSEQPVASLTYTVTGAPNNGRLELTTGPSVPITSFTQFQINSGQVVYVHDGSNTTTDVFTFSVDDGQGNAITGQTFNLTITSINDAPILGAIGNQTVNELASLTFTATATDTDLPADTLTYSLDAASIAAGMTIDANTGDFSWTPAEGQGGIHSVTVTITDDGSGSLSDSETFNITVNEINVAPLINDDSATVDEGQNVVINLVANDTDADNALDLSSITITAAPTNGSLVDNGDGTLTYGHDGSKTTSDRFSYSINDVSGATSNIASVSLTVNPANDNDPADSTDSDPILLDDPVTDEDEDSDVENPTYKGPGEDALAEDEPLLLVEEYLAPEFSGDADDSFVLMKDPQDEETQEIIYLTDEIDRDAQSEGRDDDRGYTYYDNDLYKDMSSLEYWNLIDYAAQSEPVVVNLDDISILDFDGDDSDPVVANDDYDSLRQEIDESFNSELKSQGIKAKIVTVTAATFTVGIVSYLLRAGSLVASMMSALPLWRGFDPIAIFSGDKKRKKKQDEISDAGELTPEAIFDDDVE